MITESNEINEKPICEEQHGKGSENNVTTLSVVTTSDQENGQLKESSGVKPYSKNYLKKQRKLANYERIKKERRFKEREKNKLKRQLALTQGLPLRTGPSRKELKKRQATADQNPNALRVAIDLDYDDVMSSHDVAKCVKQCLRIYTINRRSSHPGNVHFTGIKKDGQVHEAFKKNDGWENWHVSYHFDKSHTEVFSPEQLVYLTSESDSVLHRLDPECIYVIGGLVDHNHKKGLCHGRAITSGLRTARLPLSEHVDMKTRSVLSTFHVFEILVRVSEGKTWTEAILETIPARKGAKAKLTNKMDIKENETAFAMNLDTEREVASDCCS